MKQGFSQLEYCHHVETQLQLINTSVTSCHIVLPMLQAA